MHLSLYNEDALVVLKVEVIIHLGADFALLVVALAVGSLEAIFSFSSIFLFALAR
jgi:hypothetical protein